MVIFSSYSFYFCSLSFCFMFALCGMFMCSFMFVTAQEGVVLRVNYSHLLGAAAPASPLPVTINLRSLQRMGSVGAAQLPTWIVLQARLDSRARLHGVCSLPVAPSIVDAQGNRKIAAEWDQE